MRTAMKVLVTAHRGCERGLLEELKDLGSFQGTAFKDVLMGEVDDLNRFLEETDKRALFSLSRIAPIEKSFRFSPKNAVEVFKAEVKPFVDRIGRGETFCVKVNRRGMKGIISSQQMAKEVGSFIWTLLKERDGVEPKVDLKDPNKAIVFETLGNWCGISLISKEMRKRYFYVRL